MPAVTPSNPFPEGFDDDDDSPDYEEYNELDECGLTSDGLCMYAGTEHCDIDCPFSR